MIIKSTKKIGKLFLEKLDIDSLFYLKKFGYLYEKGWFSSFNRKEPYDLNGNPIPWYTYPAINFISKRVNSQMMVFEYGCGLSTLWWASRVKEVISCEHNKEWYEKLKSQMPPNVCINHISLEHGGAYSKKLSEFSNMFDIIVIDGRDRVNCAKHAINALKSDGIIIWDNSERQSYEEGYRNLEKQGFRRIDFEGMGPINIESWCTSIFYRDGNCLGI